jgi:cytochrome c oxidase subunit 2
MRRARNWLVFTAIVIVVAAIAAGFAWLSLHDWVQQGAPTYRGEIVQGMPRPWQFNFAFPGSPIQRELYDLHNLLFLIDLVICGLVAVLLIYAVWRFRAGRNPEPSRTTHDVRLEIAWTVIPVAILIGIAIPSAKALYDTETLPEADVTLKVTGHQWYWDYEYPDFQGVQVSSNVRADRDLAPGDRAMRLLATDGVAVVPVGAVVRIQMTSTDVVHSFAIPSLGIKRDAVPGRLSEVWTKIEREGLYFGQCSELCGRGHAYMPIAIKAVAPEAFKAWIDEAKKHASLASPGGAAPRIQGDGG